MVSDESWNKFLKYDGQSAKTLELSSIHNLSSVALFCNINPPFCSQCFDYKHSKNLCPLTTQFCEICGQSQDKEDCTFEIGCANCLRNGKKDTTHFYCGNCSKNFRPLADILWSSLKSGRNVLAGFWNTLTHGCHGWFFSSCWRGSFC